MSTAPMTELERFEDAIRILCVSDTPPNFESVFGKYKEHYLNFWWTLWQAAKADQAAEAKVAYVDGIHWQHHIGVDAQAVPLYSSVENTLKYESCSKECGVVEVELRERSWPIKQDLKTTYTLDEWRAKLKDGK